MDALGVLNGTVKYYDWGGFHFIPSLLGVNNDGKKPFAEYWMGVHPQAACLVMLPGGAVVSLSDYLSGNAVTALGAGVATKFGSLPYLLKVLDVRDMLSIQVHPSKAQAEKDFRAENEKGIPIDSPQRNYKDSNHKPELMVALGDFWLLHGFKPVDELLSTLNAVPELQPLSNVFTQHGYPGLYRHVMQMPQAEVNLHLQPLINRIVPLYKEGNLDKSDPAYWAAKATLTFSKPGKTDRGIYSVYLFNLVRLHRGDAIFQDAGIPHAYLEGQNVEIMASSDNVLRGGLTTKHVDVPELLKHVKCEATHPRIDKGVKQEAEFYYKTPAPDFELSGFVLNKGDEISIKTHTAEILILIEGEVQVSNHQSGVTLKKGQPSAIALSDQNISIKAAAPSWLFKSTVPVATVD